MVCLMSFGAPAHYVVVLISIRVMLLDVLADIPEWAGEFVFFIPFTRFMASFIIQLRFSTAVWACHDRFFFVHLCISGRRDVEVALYPRVVVDACWDGTSVISACI